MLKLRRSSLILALLFLGGCSASGLEQSADGDDPLGDPDLSTMSAAQAAEISDRKATVDEYQAAFQRFRECLSAAGFELENVALNNQVYDFGVPNAAVDDGADGKCYEEEYKFTDMLWQSSDAVQSGSQTAQFVRECLQEHGLEPADTLDEMSTQLREAGIEPPECL